MTKATDKHALYLVKDGEHPTLFHGDDVEQARADGWKEPDFRRGNGEEWNPDERQAERDAAAEQLKAKEESDAKEAKAAAKKPAK